MLTLFHEKIAVFLRKESSILGNANCIINFFFNKLTLYTKCGKWYYIIPESWLQTRQTGKKEGNRVKFHDWVHLRHRTLHISEIACSKFAKLSLTLIIYIYCYQIYWALMFLGHFCARGNILRTLIKKEVSNPLEYIYLWWF